MAGDSDNLEQRPATLAAAAASFALLAILVGIGLAQAGRMTPRMVVDSSSYTDYEFFPIRDALRAQRTPGYPAFLGLIDLVGSHLQDAAVGHWIVHAMACGLFAWGLNAIWKSPMGCAFVGSSMLFANIIYRYVDNITPDVLAISVATATVGLALRFARQRSALTLGLAALGVFVCCQLRPAYLFMLPLIPLLVAGFRWIDGERLATAAKSVVGIAAACFVPTAAYCLIRFALVGYVGLVSFGGNNLAGVMCAYLDEAGVEALPESSRELGRRVLQRRVEFAAEHDEFPSGVVTSFSAIERQFDDSTWRICVPAALEMNDGDWPKANKAMMSLGFGIIRAKPRQFVVWLLKASRAAAQTAAAELVGNPAYLLLLILLGLARLVRLVQERGQEPTSVREPDRVLQSLVFLSLLFLVAKTSLVILTSPPLGRFMDAAAIFLCTVPAYALFREVGRIRSSADAITQSS